MTRPYIQTLESNVKTPRGSWTQNLGRYTYLLGPNRSHKTTIIQAAELSTTGMVDDLMGRNEVKSPAMLMALKAEGEDKLFAKATFTDGSVRSWEGKPGSKPKTQGLDKMFVVSRVARKMMAGTNEKLCEAMIELLDMGQVLPGMVTSEMSSASRDKYEEVATNLRKRFGSETRVLSMVLDYAGKKQRELLAESKAFKQVMSHYEDLGTSGDVTDEMIVNIINSVVPPELPQLRMLQEVMRHAYLNGYDQCPGCGTEVGHKHLEACSEHFAAQVVDEVSTDWINKRLKLVFAAQARWETFLSVKRQYEDCKAEEQVYKALKKSCQEALKRMVESAIEDFCKDVDKYLPGAWNLAYNKTLGVLGLEYGMRGVLTALSGAEWATVISAIACAVGDRLPPGEPQLLIVEDRAWDPVTLREVMIGLRNFPGQVLMQGTVKPRGKLLQDWTLVSSVEFTQQFLPKQNGLVQKPKVADISRFQVEMLGALGFDPEDVKMMTLKTVRDITTQGLMATNVEVHADGGWSLREGGNLRILGKDT